MRDQQHHPAALELRSQALLPIGLHARERILERFRARKIGRSDIAVARIETRMAPIVHIQWRRRYVVAASPDLDLCLAVTLSRLRLVQALQRTIVALVEPPVALNRQPQQIELIEHEPLGS